MRYLPIIVIFDSLFSRGFGFAFFHLEFPIVRTEVSLNVAALY